MRPLSNSIRAFLRTNLRVLYLCGFASLLYGRAMSEETVPKDWRELAQRIASEREKIVSYKVKIIVKRELFAEPNFDRKIKQGESEYYFEFSRLENHFVYASKTIDTENKSPSVWQVSGTSETVRFAGSGKKIGVSSLVEVKPLYFDPLLAGMGFCEFFNGYISYEDALLSISRRAPLLNSIKDGGNGTLVWTCPSDGIKMTIDSRRGYWPTAYEAFHIYNFEKLRRDKVDKIDKVLAQVLIKKGDFYLPLSTNMSCFTDGKVGKEVIGVEFDWRAVNEPIKTGSEAPDSVANTLGMAVVKMD
jgi:hypothetical protein